MKRSMVAILLSVPLMLVFSGCATHKLENQLKTCKDDMAAQQSAAKKNMDDMKANLDICATVTSQIAAQNVDYAMLNGALQAEIDSEALQIIALANKVQIRLPTTFIFSSDSDELNDKGKDMIKKLAANLKKLQGRLFMVEGNTDNIPTGPNSPYKSNWDLSYARALAVVTFLMAQGIDPANLGAAAMSQYHPIASNDTADGRKKNRRIEIEILPQNPITIPLQPPAPPAIPGK